VKVEQRWLLNPRWSCRLKLHGEPRGSGAWREPKRGGLSDDALDRLRGADVVWRRAGDGSLPAHDVMSFQCLDKHRGRGSGVRVNWLTKGETCNLN
jgi:hypothetical protein